MSDKPYWWPQLKDDEWRAQLRKDYEEAADMNDEELDDHYGEGANKYVDLWDHLGDAREEYQYLADAFLKLVAETGKTPEDFEK
jgi:hypothetical protein